MRIAGFRIFNHREAVSQTQPVTGPAQGEAGAEEVPALVLPIHPGGIEDDIRMKPILSRVKCVYLQKVIFFISKCDLQIF